ncbi:MAG TPA: SDR family oxidoreductase [Spirochaetia bacterium]|nr:SDR family oxidoreductase [Spirochaetia bacterium]
MVDLGGKTAIVTGAARRIGAAVARALAGRGVHVVAHYRASSSDAEEMVAELSALGVRSVAVAADFRTSGAAEMVFEEALRLTGKIDLLVNSASIFDEVSMAETTERQLHDNLQINAVVPFLLSRLLGSHIRARAAAGEEARGAIVNFLDSRITDYDRRHLPYAVSKRALHTISQMTALELAPSVRVNAVAPGLILPPSGEGPEYLERLKSTNPLHSYGTLQQITESVLFLLSNEFVTGQTLFVDGGRHLKGSVYGS